MSDEIVLKDGYQFPKEKKMGNPKMVKIPQSLSEGMHLAIDTQPEMTAYCAEIVKAVKEGFGGGDCKWEFNLKGFDRAEDKLQRKYKGDMTKMEDLARCRITCDTLEQIRFIQKYIEKTADVLKMEDKLQDPNPRGYRDLKYTMVASNGLKVEMQLNVRELVRASKRSHPVYEEIREITEQAKDRELTPDEQKSVQEKEKECRDYFCKAVYDYNRRTKGEKLELPGRVWVPVNGNTR